MSKPFLQLKKSNLISGKHVVITGSKSESNRVLLLQALYPQIEIDNLSNSDDTALMSSALKTEKDVVDIHHAGTAMRFLTAYFATQEGYEKVVTGSDRMKERPIKILVDALMAMGAKIEYLENEGYPPLKIHGSTNLQSVVKLAANVSSQYISALLLVGSSLQKGLQLKLLGAITSRPYIKMTLALLNEIGVVTEFRDNSIEVQPIDKSSIPKTKITVESDWSSASYFYSIVALSDVGTEIYLSHFKENSLQGDSSLVSIYRYFGVETIFENSKIRIRKEKTPSDKSVTINLVDSPDLAQTIAVTAFGLDITCTLLGLHTLKIKETDRLKALESELQKIGACIKVSEDALFLDKGGVFIENQTVETYNDHRMAMAFAPLAIKGNLHIEDPAVVSKSYPDFWQDLRHIGFVMK